MSDKTSDDTSLPDENNISPDSSDTSDVTVTPDGIAADVPASNSNGKKIAIGAVAFFGVLSFCLVGAYAYNVLSGKTAGSAKPEDVITNTFSALEKHDLVGALRQADPNEVQPFLENIDTFAHSMKKNNISRDEKKPLEAYSYSVEGLKTKTVKYSDTIARVELVEGKITKTVDKKKLPKNADAHYGKSKQVFNIKDANEQWRDGYYQDYLSYYSDEDNFDPSDLESRNIFYVAVKRGDRWYVSSLYTTAEYIRIMGNAYGGDYKQPTFDENDRIAVGADSPEKATENFLQELVSLDIKKTIETTAPDRFSVGHDYKKLLVQASKNNEDNEYWNALHGAVDITKLETSKTSEGKNREFISVDFISTNVKYDVKTDEKNQEIFSYYPYAADLKATWNGKCYSLTGSTKMYNETANYFPTATFPLTDSNGDTYERSDFDEDYPEAYDLEFPVHDAAGHIYPEGLSLTDGTVYHPVPWKNADGTVEYDAKGNYVEQEFDDYSDDYNYEEDDYSYDYSTYDANGNQITDEDGNSVDDDLEYRYESKTTKVNEKDCYSSKELHEMPEFGVVTIKENGKYYVSPIDTMWHYIIWGIDHDTTDA